MRTERGLERLVFFSDAVVAIAITLLVLPLVEIWPTAAGEGDTPLPVLQEHAPQLLAFALSFLVIARLWLIHHRIFERVLRASRMLVALNMAWLLTIVVLPVWTAVIAAYDPSTLTVGLYTGTIALSSTLLVLSSVVLMRDTALSEPEHAQTARGVLNGAVPTGLMIVGAVLGTVFAATVNYFGLFILVLSRPVLLLALRLGRIR